MVAVDDDHLTGLGGGGREHGGGHRERDGAAELTHPHYNDHGGEGLRRGPENARVRPLVPRGSAARVPYPAPRAAPAFCSSSLRACALASCGGGEDQESVEDLLDRAFSGEIRSADLKLEGEIELKGLIKDPIRIEAEGPFRTNAGQAALGRHRAADRLGRRRPDDHQRRAHHRRPRLPEVPGRLLRAAAARRCARPTATLQRNGDKGDQPLSELGPRPALMAGRGQGRGRRRGGRGGHPPRVRHARRGQPDAQPQRVRAASRRRRWEPRGKNAAPRLTGEDIRELSEAVKDPSFDVYVGKQDDLIRRVSGRIEFEIPEAEPRAAWAASRAGRSCSRSSCATSTATRRSRRPPTRARCRS